MTIQNGTKFNETIKAAVHTEFNLKNLILNTDSYKPSHWLQYPEGATNQFSYIESRGGDHPYTVMFGLQIFLKEYLTTPITQTDIDEADAFISEHIGPNIFNRAG